MKRLLLVFGLVFAVACQQTASDETAGTPQPVPTTTSPSQPTASVPNVVGKRTDNARNALEAAGFEVSISTKYTGDAPAGTVLHQSLDAGTSAKVGRSIVLLVAKAFPIVPNVVGEKLAAARRTLKGLGFDVRTVKQVSSQPKDTVISQTPVGGTEARPGRQVTIVLAKPAPAPPTQNCTSGYSPCLIYHGGADYDCSGGSGDGPYYTEPGVVYTVSGSDPYDLDADNDGHGCE